MSKRMIKNIVFVLVLNILILFAINYFYIEPVPNLKLEKLRNEYIIKDTSSVDHTQFAELHKDFKSPQEVTIACLSCHNGTHKEIMASNHWNWQRVSYIEGRGIRALGKKNILNNFCIGAESNEKACSKCHIGYGMTDDHFDFTNQSNVDCMVCHDNSEGYIKGSSMAGYPAREVNLSMVAQSVSKTTKSNCGACHFYSGGGNNVKHGDLEEALLACTREVDVHMAANGIDLSCTDCHTSSYHNIKGKLYSVSSSNTNRVLCEDCHTSIPHMNEILNEHSSKVACQTCHIPTYAKENATKMAWKWSDAGELKDGKPYSVDDSLGNHSYMSIKGSFVWEKNVVPELFRLKYMLEIRFMIKSTKYLFNQSWFQYNPEIAGIGRNSTGKRPLQRG
jgi:octaheme c-type cytochrome (tetrathionate reductase family)